MSDPVNAADRDPPPSLAQSFGFHPPFPPPSRALISDLVTPHRPGPGRTGLHDTNDEGFDEESRDEYVPPADYGANLKRFVAKIRQHQPQAKIAWLSSTPMHVSVVTCWPARQGGAGRPLACRSYP